jgi:hypothetical protein
MGMTYGIKTDECMYIIQFFPLNFVQEQDHALILVGENLGEIMQHFFHKGGISWAILISRLVILGVHAPVIIPPSQMRNARPIHYSNVSLFKTIELTKPPIQILDAPPIRLWVTAVCFLSIPGRVTSPVSPPIKENVTQAMSWAPSAKP